MSVKKFGPFILDRMIGRGGMGAVYRARDENTGQIVAVKALLLPLERERERFEAEISTLRLLRHENIVKLYGFGQEDGILYYAMEFVDGPSLATLLRRGRRFTWEETLYIGARICNALKHAHDRGVIHRDIKPANILLMSDGVVKVSDYGIAQYFGNSRLTNANQVVGTIEFMAPEQAQAGAVTPKTDVYSLGALMYALLTGRPPYVAKTLPELLQKFREGFPGSVRSLRPEIPKVVDDVVLDLLQLQPEKRPGDARLIGRRLEALLYTSPTCKNGNPFLNSRFSTYGSNRAEDQKSEVPSSRVDLENDSTTMCKDDGNEFKLDEEAPPVRDFPYRPIVNEVDDNFDFESPFDKTTERATKDSASSEERGQRPEERRDDFFVGDGKDPEDAGLSESETSTGERQVVGKEAEQAPSCAELNSKESTEIERAESVEISDAATMEQSTGVPSAETDDFVVRPTVEAGLSPPDGRETAKSTEFDVSYNAGSAGGAIETDAEITETASSDSMGLLSAKSSALNSETPTLAASAPSEVARPKLERSARLLSAAATTIVEKTVEKLVPTKKRKIVEPIAPNGAIVPSRNVPFEELGETSDEVEATPLDKFRKSVFTAVDEDELGEFPKNDDDYAPSIFVRFRVLWLLLVVAALVGIVTTSFRAPSADRLYAKIDRTFSRSTAKRFDATLRRSEKDMKRFVELYPNDPRSEKINYFLCEIQIDELDQRLERQVLSPGRDAPLQPIVRAYLEARRAAQENWEEGSKRLAAFIELFGSETIVGELDAEDGADESTPIVSGEEKSASSLRGLVVQNRWKLWKGGSAPVMSLHDQLVVIAKRRLVALDAEMKTTRRADVALLNDRLITAASIEKENPKRAEAIRRAAEVLYGRYEWAQKALSEPVVVPDDETLTIEDDSESEDATSDAERARADGSETAEEEPAAREADEIGENAVDEPSDGVGE